MCYIHTTAAAATYLVSPIPFLCSSGLLIGTTAAGLRFGCPTWICPFFGDQFFWGEMVHRNLLGPKPCSIPSLSLSIISESLEALLGDKGFLANSVSMRRALLFEDGVEGACRALYKHLPLENMLCEVSIFMGLYRLAKVMLYCPIISQLYMR
jgi:hypothetical protein